VAIHRLLQKAASEPEDIMRMVIAYERAPPGAWTERPHDPPTESVAKLIVELAQTGENDPDMICALALGLAERHRPDGVARRSQSDRLDRTSSLSVEPPTSARQLRSTWFSPPPARTRPRRHVTARLSVFKYKKSWPKDWL